MFNWLKKRTHILTFNIRNYYAQNHHSIRISELFRWFQTMNFDSIFKHWEGMDNHKPCGEAVCKCDHKTVGEWQFWVDAFHATSSEPPMLRAASSAVLSRLHTSIWYFIFSVISLLIVLRILFTRPACTLVISTRPTINLHATGERAGVNFGHCY